MRGRGERRAGRLEVWAARAWNVLNEGRPFSLAYPALCLLAAAPLGLGPDGPLVLALLGAAAMATVLSRFPFALRGRALLWLALALSAPLLEPGRAPALLLGALAGYAFFTVLFWGTLYYRLRTGAPWTNFARFWRLVLTASDPTSGNALEHVPKLLMALSAGALLAEQPTPASAARIAAAAAVAAVLGLVARRLHRARLPVYPPPLAAGAAAPPGRGPGATAPTSAPAPARGGEAPPGRGDGATARTTPPALARRVYVIVVDGANRDRLRQARTPTLDRLAREGTEYLEVATAYPARTVTCFSSMLTGAAPAEHGMRSNFVGRAGVRRPSVFEALESHGRRGRLVGIAHLLDAFPERHVRSVTSVQPTARIDRSLVAAAREVVERDDPDLLVLQLLAADQLGHVRGTRNPEYLAQLEQTDRRVADFLAWLAERGLLEGATVVLMADHGQGRGIGGHGHLDWGESPVPFVVWGAGAVPGAVSHEPRSVLELAATVSRLLGVEAPAGARGRPLVPVEDPGVTRAAPGGSCLAVIRDGDGRLARRVLDQMPLRAAGLALEPVLALGADRPAGEGVEVIRAADREEAVRAGARLALARGHGALVLLEAGGYRVAETEALLLPVAQGRAEHVLGSRFLVGSSLGWRTWLRERAACAVLGTLARTVLWDARSGFRAFGPRAVAALAAAPAGAASIRVLARAGMAPLELPVSYSDPARGARHCRASRATSSTSAAPSPAASAYGPGEWPKNGNSPDQGSSGRPAARPAPPQRTSA